jgi:hypothetical protein
MRWRERPQFGTAAASATLREHYGARFLDGYSRAARKCGPRAARCRSRDGRRLTWPKPRLAARSPPHVPRAAGGGRRCQRAAGTRRARVADTPASRVWRAHNTTAAIRRPAESAPPRRCPDRPGSRPGSLPRSPWRQRTAGRAPSRPESCASRWPVRRVSGGGRFGSTFGRGAYGSTPTVARARCSAALQCLGLMSCACSCVHNVQLRVIKRCLASPRGPPARRHARTARGDTSPLHPFAPLLCARAGGSQLAPLRSD